ncbi:ESX secretion-associated protein EspG [Actinokineospora pegani]|uniref:ESX secretion-associated protein EspG n=1 Tax=Actinokineospora pegani TaxID=2654637 RepID=UPI0018D40807|nr:ESX secretion-associated protein EspG [Actinokineospora pegani]
MLDKPITLSLTTATRVVTGERLGKLHITLEPEALWYPPDEDIRATTEVRTELAALGALDRRGRADADLVAVLALLCTPRTEFYGWMAMDGRTTGALVAASGRTAVLATQDTGTLTITPAPADRPAETLLRHLPELRPARGPVITAFAEDIQAAAGGVNRTAAGVRQAPPVVRELQRISGLPTTGGGQLYTALRHGNGQRHSTPQPIRYVDTVQGRYQNVTLPRGQVLVGPADRAALAGRLYDAHRALPRES